MNKIQNFNKDFRRALGSFPTGVTVVTTMDKNNKPIGFTANSFTSFSQSAPNTYLYWKKFLQYPDFYTSRVFCYKYSLAQPTSNIYHLR